MTEHELIAKQQLQIEEMRKTLKECANAFRTIRSVIYCIGGPLNDNKRGYSHEQMKDFLRIANECMALEDSA